MLRGLLRPQTVLYSVRWLRSSARFPSSSNEAIAVDQDIDLSKPQTVVCKNGVIACWHPEEAFPYEHTRPIDINLLSKKTSKVSSVLREEVVLESERSRLKLGPDNSELKEIFYTPKNEWYTRSREERLYDVAAPLPKRK